MEDTKLRNDGYIPLEIAKQLSIARIREVIAKDKMNDPFFRYTIEELQNMSHEEFCAVIEESNEYVRKKHSRINEQEMPRFNTIEELRAYYDCMPFDEIPGIYVDDIDEYAKANGYLTQEEYNQRINNAMAVCSQSPKRFYGPEDLTKENYEKFCQEIDELSRKADEENRLLTKTEIPEFKSIEEVRKYYNSVPFEEWERQMMDRLGRYPLETLTEEQRRHFDNSLAQIESDREQEEFIEQCRHELEARVIELRNKKQ